MPPRRADSRKNKNGNRNGNQQALSALIDPLNEQVSHAEFMTALWCQIKLCPLRIINFVALINPNSSTITIRVEDFTQINPPEFHYSKTGEDLQEFLNDIQKFTEIMGITLIKSVEYISIKISGAHFV